MMVSGGSGLSCVVAKSGSKKATTAYARITCAKWGGEAFQVTKKVGSGAVVVDCGNRYKAVTCNCASDNGGCRGADSFQPLKGGCKLMTSAATTVTALCMQTSQSQTQNQVDPTKQKQKPKPKPTPTPNQNQ